ncbi:hypothetical protein JOE57_001443 [Microlunatus panaciterrae]|uniref:Right handed beta helix region n=1 Tax=Microlunatus panaciterrae TaxID=400768 RepID=A0ABS2RIW8_9ACTN|nr:hypothetical protein [Microlunatus panaciterrae]MBM7798522.1 hypothetical protein [Microlunatus panaciterrae]
MSVAPGKSVTAKYGPKFTNGIAGASFVVPQHKSDVYVGVQLRTVGKSAGYRARVLITKNGTLRVGISRGETVLLSQSITGKALPGQTIRVEGLASGSTPVKVAVRAWVVGKAKPGWQKTINDRAASRVTRSGYANTWAYLPSNAAKSVKIIVTSRSATPAKKAVAKKKVIAKKKVAPKKVAPKKKVVTKTTVTKIIGGKPSAANTGVPAGTKLKQHRGNITITKAGTHLNGLDIHGFVNVKAKNVTISNSIIRGGRETVGNNQGLVSNFGYANFVIENSEIKAEHPSKWFIGLRGWNFTARRIHIIGNVDTVMIHGDNVRIERSLLEKTDWYASHPMQNGGPTHSDGIQILQGRNIDIVGNTIRGIQNFPILGSASTASIPDLNIEGNYLDSGWCSLKLQTRNHHSLAATVRNNKFGPNRHEKQCVFLAPPEVKLTASGNVFEANGRAIRILRVAG